MIKLDHLEAAITHHCVNACCGCNHFSPIMLPRYMDVATLGRDLVALSKVASFRKFALLGGEPLLHPQISDMIRMARGLEIFEEVAVITNGQLLDGMDDAFWYSVTHLEIDIYPGKPVNESYINQKAQEHGVKVLYVRPTTFYKSCSPAGQSEAQIQARYDKCPTRKECYAVDNGLLYKCPQSAILPLVFKELAPLPCDGIKIYSLTEERLRAFIDSPKPLFSCRRCSVTESFYPWHECSRKNWLKESTI